MKRALLFLALVGCEKKADPLPARVAPAITDAKVEIPEVRIRAGVRTPVRVSWSAPKGTAINDDAPFRVRWNRSDGLADAPADVKSSGSNVKNGFDVTVQPLSPNATLDGDIDIVVCDSKTHSVCVPVHRSVTLGFIAVNDAPATAQVTIPLPEARP
jgi:hypothetical protein